MSNYTKDTSVYRANTIVYSRITTTYEPTMSASNKSTRVSSNNIALFRTNISRSLKRSQTSVWRPRDYRKQTSEYSPT